MFLLTVHFHIKPEFSDAFAKAVTRQAVNSKTNETDCLQFDVGRSATDPNHFFLYEVYTSAAAFEAHRQTPYFAEFTKTIGDMVQSKELASFDRIEPV
jgi:(4S)-4-hydroxy-5-phosphonooxypentane-2,3-dione isomerase